MKRNNFFSQTAVLISRYLKIFFNDKQSLSLTIALPILTIIVVTLVASDKMFCNDVDNTINGGYPLLFWESVEYEDSVDEKNDSEDDTPFKTWDGVVPGQPQLVPLDEDGNEYSINFPGDLQFIAMAKGEWLQKTYYLNCDVDMEGQTLLPIGTKSEPFTGKFNGNGHIIRNFVLEANDECIGLFGSVKGTEANICNLGIQDAKITSGGYSECVGLLVGLLEDATIEDCYSKQSSVNVEGSYVGGVVGKLSGSDATLIRNCYSRADINVGGENVGGIVGGIDEGRIQYTYFAGTLTSNDSAENTANFGAIAGAISNGKSIEDTFKCIYDKDKISKFSAVGNSNKSNTKIYSQNDVIGWTTKKLQKNASLIRSLDKDIDEDDVNGSLKNDGELFDFTGTQTGLFMLACVAIFVGICNSIQEICKERNILKREYMTNLRLSSYITSKLVVQGLVCAVQILLIMVIFFISISGKSYPSSGVVFGSAMIEMYITMFLVAFASDTIALLISSIVKNSSTANTFIPIVLIVQIVFSGVLFELGETMNTVANIMISKWGIAALAATCRLNEGRLALLLENPEMSLQMGDKMNKFNDLFVATPQNLFKIWGILMIFIVVCAVLSGILLKSVKKDKR